MAIEQFDLSEYKYVISSSHSFAKGVITSPDQLHISYVHTPMRYAWDQMHVYIENSPYKKLGLNLFIKLILHDLRKWDYLSSVRVDNLVANSKFHSKKNQKILGQ